MGTRLATESFVLAPALSFQSSDQRVERILVVSAVSTVLRRLLRSYLGGSPSVFFVES